MAALISDWAWLIALLAAIAVLKLMGFIGEFLDTVIERRRAQTELVQAKAEKFRGEG